MKKLFLSLSLLLVCFGHALAKKHTNKKSLMRRLDKNNTTTEETDRQKQSIKSIRRWHNPSQAKRRSNVPMLIKFDQAMKCQPNFKECMAGSNVLYTRNLPEGVTPADFIGLVKKLYTKNHFAKLQAELSKNQPHKIPPIIHQIWFGEKVIPALYKTWQKEWLETHPDWTLIEWNEEKIKKEFPQGLYNQKIFDDAKKANNYARMSDVARYEVLKKYGGLYIDYDVKCLSSFEPLHYVYDFYAGLEHFGGSGYCCNAVIGAIPSHPIIESCLQKIKTYENKEPDLTLWPYKTPREKERLITFITTGPTLLTHAIWHGADKDDHTDIIFPQIYLYPFKPMKISLCYHGFHSMWVNMLSDE